MVSTEEIKLHYIQNVTFMPTNKHIIPPTISLQSIHDCPNNPADRQADKHSDLKTYSFSR